MRPEVNWGVGSLESVLCDLMLQVVDRYSSLRPAAVKLPATRRLAPREAPSWQLPTGLCGTVIQYAPGSHQPVGPPTSGTWDSCATRQDAHGHEEHAFPIESILRESTDGGGGTGREEPTQQRTTQHRAASAVAKSCQAQGVATPPCHRHQRIPLYLDVRPKGARPPPLANVPKRQERRPVRKGKRAPHCRCALHSMSMSVSSASSTTSVPSSNRPKQKMSREGRR